MYRFVFRFGLGAFAVLAATGAAFPQQVTPLQKSDVIRLLTGGTYSDPEIVSLIGRSCLSFGPTARDMDNFRALGASASVIQAIQACSDAGRVEPVEPVLPPPPPPAPVRIETAPTTAAAAATPDLTLFVSPRRITVVPGAVVTFAAELTWDAGSAPGIQIELRELLGGGLDRVVRTGRTDAGGRVVFAVPAPATPGTRRFSILVPGRAVQGVSVVEIEAVSRTGVVAGPEAGGAGGTESQDVEEALDRAERLSQQGRYGSADEIYEQLLSLDPEQVDVLLAYGSHLTRSGRHGLAEDILQRASVLEPLETEIQKSLAFVKLWSGNAREAVGLFRGVIQLSPGDAEAWRGLGQALAASGLEDEAREAFARASQLESGGV